MINLVKKKTCLVNLCLMVSLCICLIFSGCSNNNNSNVNNDTYLRPGIMKLDLTIPIIPQEQIISTADYIVEAEVLTVKESTIEKVILPLATDACDSIVTDTVVKITKVVKGDIHTDTITVRQNLGTVNDTTLICEQEPNFTKGERVLLFLCNDSLSDTYRLNCLYYSKYVMAEEDFYKNDFSGYSITVSQITTD